MTVDCLIYGLSGVPRCPRGPPLNGPRLGAREYSIPHFFLYIVIELASDPTDGYSTRGYQIPISGTLFAITVKQSFWIRKKYICMYNFFL